MVTYILPIALIAGFVAFVYAVVSWNRGKSNIIVLTAQDEPLWFGAGIVLIVLGFTGWWAPITGGLLALVHAYLLPILAFPGTTAIASTLGVVLVALAVLSRFTSMIDISWPL